MLVHFIKAHWRTVLAVVALAVVFSIAVHSLLVAGSWPWALSFTLFGCFLLATKTQHQTALPFLIAFCLLAAFRTHGKYNRTAWLLAPVFLLTTTLWMIGVLFVTALVVRWRAKSLQRQAALRMMPAQ